MKTAPQQARIESAIRRIRQRIFDMPPERQTRATAAIGTLKSRLAPAWDARHRARSDYHWMWAGY